MGALKIWPPLARGAARAMRDTDATTIAVEM